MLLSLAARMSRNAGVRRAQQQRQVADLAAESIQRATEPEAQEAGVAQQGSAVQAFEAVWVKSAKDIMLNREGRLSVK
ncbi:hypothetical protein AAKU55_005157 [Oxalobacteraceae bacterium GrIS 1.11]